MDESVKAFMEKVIERNPGEKELVPSSSPRSR